MGTTGKGTLSGVREEGRGLPSGDLRCRRRTATPQNLGTAHSLLRPLHVVEPIAGSQTAFENHAVGNLEEALSQCVITSALRDEELQIMCGGRSNITQFSARPPTELVGLRRRYRLSRRGHLFSRPHAQIVDRPEQAVDVLHVGYGHLDVVAVNLEFGREQHAQHQGPQLVRTHRHIRKEAGPDDAAEPVKLAAQQVVLGHKRVELG